MTSRISLAQLDDIGRTIDISGIATVPERVLVAVAGEATRLGVRLVAADVLASPSDPPVAREPRAYGRVASGLAASHRSEHPAHTTHRAA